MFDLEFQKQLIELGILALVFVALWKDRDEGNWRIYKAEAIEKGNKKGGLDKYFHIFQKTLHYIFRGFIVRQILNPYFLFPFLALLCWLLMIINWGKGDIILVMTLLVVLWYSKETQVLREEQRKSNKISEELITEQKKAVFLQLLDMEMKDKDSGYKVRVEYPLIVRRIIEKGEFDPKELYSRNWHQNLDDEKNISQT